MYILFLVFLLLILIFIAPIFKFEVLCPPIVCILVFILCTTLGLLRYYDWSIEAYSAKAVFYLLTAISFFITGAGGALILKGEKRQAQGAEIYNYNRVDLPYCVMAILIFIGIVNNAGFLMHIKKTLRLYGKVSTGFSNLLYQYYLLKVNQNVSISAIWKYMNMFVYASTILSIFIVTYNLCIKKFKMRDICLFFVVALNICHSFLDSSRGEMMLLLAEALYLFYFFWGMFYRWKKEVNRKIIKWGGIALILMIAAFSFLTIGLGRYQSFSDLDIVKYLTVYTSGGIRNFDLFVKDPKFSNQFGKETFYSINRFLANRFGIGELYNSPLDFRSINGMNTGNIYTSFRRYYADFGIIGLSCLPFLLGYLFTRGYYIIRTNTMNGNIGFGILVFCAFSPQLFFMPIEDRLFLMDFSVNGLIKIALLYFLYCILIEKKLAIRVNMFKRWKNVKSDSIRN